MSTAHPAAEPQPGHDIIVIGGSAGALEALFEITRALPAGLPASVSVVIHTHPEARTRTADLINARSTMPSKLAVHGEPIERPRIYVAPPDNHLMLRPGIVTVYRGPKENGHRPAVDPLFRSAAKHYGRRVVGVVLSSYQDCGSAGLLSIKARGGVAIVQSVSDAAVSDMPSNAAAQVDVDQTLPAREIGAAIAVLANRPIESAPAPAVPNTLRQFEGDEPGQPFGVVCPICAGTLTESHFRDSTHRRDHERERAALSLQSDAVQDGRARDPRRRHDVPRDRRRELSGYRAVRIMWRGARSSAARARSHQTVRPEQAVRAGENSGVEGRSALIGHDARAALASE